MSDAMSIALDPGETAHFTARFTPHLILTHLKVEVVITDSRVIVRRPNTLFGLVPLGYYEQTSPIEHISEFSAGESFSGTRLAAGVAAVLLGLSLIGFGIMGVAGLSTVLALVFIGGGAYLVASAHSVGLVFRNHGAGLLTAGASRNERPQVEQARRNITALFFGRVAGSPAGGPAGTMPVHSATAADLEADELAAAAANPATSAATLSRIAEHHRALRPAVAANPNAYPGLLEWLAALGDPDVDRAIDLRKATARR